MVMDYSFSSRDVPVLAASGVLASLAAVQLFTPADPIRRCLQFWRQLNAQVSPGRERE